MSTKTEEIKEEIKEQPKKEKAPKEEKKDMHIIIVTIKIVV